MRWEQHTKPTQTPGQVTASFLIFIPQLFSTSFPLFPPHKGVFWNPWTDAIASLAFFPEAFLFCTLGKSGLLQPASSPAASHPPGIPPVCTGQGFSSHLCGLHSLTHTELAMPSVFSLRKAVVEKLNSFSAFLLSPIKSHSATPLDWFSVLSSPFWKSVPHWKFVFCRTGKIKTQDAKCRGVYNLNLDSTSITWR